MEDGTRNRPSWPFIATVVVSSLPLMYVLSSGPMRIALERWGQTPKTHRQMYAPIVWLRDNTPAGGVVAWYWGIFEEPYHEYLIGSPRPPGAKAPDYEDGLDEWIHSPKYRAINRDLGFEDDDDRESTSRHRPRTRLEPVDVDR